MAVLPPRKSPQESEAPRANDRGNPKEQGNDDADNDNAPLSTTMTMAVIATSLVDNKEEKTTAASTSSNNSKLRQQQQQKEDNSCSTPNADGGTDPDGIGESTTTAASTTSLDDQEHDAAQHEERQPKQQQQQQQQQHQEATTTTPVQPEPSRKRRRRSMRNTNRLSLPNKSSLQYRRLDELFFQEPPRPLRQSNHTTVFRGLTLERLHAAPNIYKIHNFLNASELDHLQKKIKGARFQRSYVDQVPTSSQDCSNTSACHENDDNETANETTTHDDDDNNNKDTTTATTIYDSDHRTSMFDSFQKAQDSVIAAIERRAAELLGCWSPETCLEPLQLVRYQEGQFFGVHHDLGAYNSETQEVELPPKSLFGIKRRIATLFCYLNDVEEGGHTWFPAADDLRVPPEAGSAVLFGNVLKTGQPDARTIHSGTAVKEGTKYGLNVWYLES